MRELPEPDIRPEEARGMGLEELPYFAGESVLAIQKQAYEDGLRDAIPKGYGLAPFEPTMAMIDAGFYDHCDPQISAVKVVRVYKAMLTASQKPRCDLCGYQHGHAIGCANNPVDIALKAASQKEQK